MCVNRSVVIVSGLVVDQTISVKVLEQVIWTVKMKFMES